MKKFIYVILYIVCISAYADNQERITRFSSDIIINQDASINITENITVDAEQIQIQHGIVRWLPTRYTDSYGIHHNTRYQITRVQIDGQNSAYHIVNNYNQMAIFIGDKDIILSPGIYTFSIQYNVQNAINFLRDGDELYWNITGNAWAFPVEEVIATIYLPKTAEIQKYFGFTGLMGEKGQDYSVDKLSPNEMRFTTTLPLLKQGAGFTIAVAWQKGIVEQPSLLKQYNSPILWMASVFTLIILLYYIITWYFILRRQLHNRKGVIIPLFEPPQHISPAEMR